MHLSLNNFLTQVKNIVTGGGRTTNGQIKHDGGYLRDMNFSLQDLANDSLIANAVKQTVIIPIPTNVDFVNSAQWDLALPFAGTLNTIGYRVGKPVTTGSKLATLTASVQDVAVTGGVVSLTSATMTPTGAAVAGTAITAGNTFTAGQKIGFAVSSVTAFVEGDGYIELGVSNTDLQKLFTLSSAETNLKVVNAPASTTTIGSFTLTVPRDYDEETDTLEIKVGMAMSGSTDASVTTTASAYRKRPGSNIATVTASATGKDITQATAVTLTTAEQLVYFKLSQQGLKRDDTLTITLTAGAHTTDSVNVYFIEPFYRSTLVSYAETDDSRGRANYGNSLR